MHHAHMWNNVSVHYFLHVVWSIILLRVIWKVEEAIYIAQECAMTINIKIDGCVLNVLGDNSYIGLQ